MEGKTQEKEEESRDKNRELWVTFTCMSRNTIFLAVTHEHRKWGLT